MYRETFNIKVVFGAGYYDGDWLIDCEVTYPSFLGNDPITVDYEESGDTPEKVTGDAAKDIASYIQNPENWEKDYIKNRSSDRGKKLQLARRSLEEAQEQIASYQRGVEYQTKQIQKLQTEIAKLEEQI